MSGSDSGRARNCAGCGKPLSRYNTVNRCQACTSAGRKSNTGQPASDREPLVDGRKLAQLRHDRGWTQEMLADHAGLSREMVRKLEQKVRRSARISTVSALARALNEPMSTLLGDSPVTEPAGRLARQAEVTTRPQQEGEPNRPTLLRALIIERHWQRFKTFEAQFRRAARELAERESNPDLAKLTVSSRQWERWYAGSVKSEPRPDATRVLEHMFGYPIQQLLASREVGHEHQAEDGDEMERRRVLQSLTALGAASSRIVRKTTGFPGQPALSSLQSAFPESSWADPIRNATLDPVGAARIIRQLPDSDQFTERIGDLCWLRRAANNAVHSHLTSDYSQLARALPLLIGCAETASVQGSDTDYLAIQRVLCDVYVVAGWTLIKANSPEVAWIAAQRALNTAQQIEDAFRSAAAMRCLSEVHMRAENFAEASRLALVATLYLDASPEADGKRAACLKGAALLSAAAAAARRGDSSEAYTALKAAASCSARLDEEVCELGTTFGPVNVAIHRVAVAVELGDAQGAVSRLSAVNLSRIPEALAERRARFLIDAARAYADSGDATAAIASLTDAEKIAPEEVRNHRLTRELLQRLLLREKRTSGLRQLAYRCEVLN